MPVALQCNCEVLKVKKQPRPVKPRHRSRAPTGLGGIIHVRADFTRSASCQETMASVEESCKVLGIAKNCSDREVIEKAYKQHVRCAASRAATGKSDFVVTPPIVGAPVPPGQGRRRRGIQQNTGRAPRSPQARAHRPVEHVVERLRRWAPGGGAQDQGRERVQALIGGSLRESPDF